MKTLRIREVKSYFVHFDELPRCMYWFNDNFNTGTWSDSHIHEKWGELVYIPSGKMTVCTERRTFFVHQNKMLWIPPGMEHEWYIADATNDRSLYISPAALPKNSHFAQCCMLSSTPLVCELINALVDIPHLYDPGPDERFVHTLLDQLIRLPQTSHSLPLPKDRQLLVMCTRILKNPDIAKTLRQWGEELGMSERTLARRFFQQTGETFGKWRQQVRLVHAMEQLQAGETVTSVSLNCGYSSVSAFIDAFKKAHGNSPGVIFGYRQPADTTEFRQKLSVLSKPKTVCCA